MQIVNQSHAPAGQDDRLRAAAGLARNAGHMREVRTPLPAVQAVAPELADLHALRRRAAQCHCQLEMANYLDGAAETRKLSCSQQGSSAERAT